MNKLKITGAVILIVLLLLIFFSGTIYNYNIPEVNATLPKNGRLSKSETSTGIADWAKTYEIYFELGGRVEEVLVEEGERITEGAPMARLAFDLDDMEMQLAKLEIDRDKTVVSIETNNLRISKLKSQAADISAEVYEEDEVSDYAVTQLAAKLERAKEARAKAEESYSQLETLFEAGAISKNELDAGSLALASSEHELNSLALEYENAQTTKAENEKKNAKTIEDKEKSRQTQLNDIQYEIESLYKDIETKNLEIQKNLDEQEFYKKQLQTYSDNIMLYAPYAGEIVSLSSKSGQTVNKNQLFASIGLGNTFNVMCNLSLDNNFVAAGDECRISNTDHAFAAVVARVSPTDMAKAVTVKISSDEIKAGETFDVEFGKEAANSAIIVPNGAVNKDSDGYFVYYIKKRKGILGDEYFAERSPVYIGDSDNESTIITKGITFFEPIILLADKQFSNGDTIKVKNEGDFFVD